jgi:hypothetical protein
MSHHSTTAPGHTRTGAITLAATMCMILTSCVFNSGHSAPQSHAPAPSASTHPTAAPAPPQQPTTPGSPPGVAATALSAEFATLQNTLHGTLGLVVSAVGTNATQLVFGNWTSGPAWSTMKVPLTITALNNENPPTVTAPMRAAITQSDNDAAEAIWEGLNSDPVAAAHDVEAVLKRYGDPTTVEWQRRRPPFTAFGQTIWSLTNQARFTAGAVCDDRSAQIFTLMGNIEDDQRWGLGIIPDTRFKGGWGPSTAGNYLVRQLGVLKTPSGLTAVAVATEPASGAFGDGTQDLTEVSKWLMSHLSALPAGHCDH